MHAFQSITAHPIMYTIIVVYALGLYGQHINRTRR